MPPPHGTKISRKENETPEERAKRRAEKKKTVDLHRAEILRRVNQTTGRSKLHKRDELVCPITFDNTLPPVPVDAKAVAYQFDEDFMYGFDLLNGVSSEPAFLYQMHTEADVGVPINLIDPEQFIIPPPAQRPKLDPADEFITSAQFAKPAIKHAENQKEEAVDWIFSSTYMHLDLYDAVYKHADPKELKIAKLVTRKKQLDAAVVGTLRERIEESFRTANLSTPPVHPTNKNLKPKRMWSVLPDSKRWAAHEILASFDANPDPHGNTAAFDAIEKALIRTPASQPVNLSDGTVRVDYLLPKEAGDAAEYEGIRSYHMVVEKVQRNKGDEHYVLHWDDDHSTAYFAPIKGRALLTRVAAEEEVGSRMRGSRGVKIQSAVVSRRPLLPEERDCLDEAEADIFEADPTPIKVIIADRRKARQAERLAASRVTETAPQVASVETSPAYVSGGKRTAAEAFGGQTDEIDDSAVFGEED